MTTPINTPERVQARQIKARVAAQIEAVRANRDLTDLGRSRQIAELSAGLKDELARLKTQEQNRLQAEHDKLERQAFSGAVARRNSSPSDLISLRDAADRAAQAKKPDEAAALLDRAHDSGDESLAAAVARHALRRGLDSQLPGSQTAWEDIVTRYAHHPSRADRVLPVLYRMADIEDALQPAPNLYDDFVSISPPEPAEAASGAA